MSSVRFWFGSGRPGFCLGTSLLVTLMLLMYAGGIQASLSVGPGGDFPRFTGNSFFEFRSHRQELVKIKTYAWPFPLLRCVPVCSQPWWAALSAGQCSSGAAAWILSGAPLGDSRLTRPLHPDNHCTTFSLHPAPLYWWGWGEPDLWLLCRPACFIYSTVSTGDAEEGAEMSACLVSPVAFSADWSAAVARDTSSASLLCNMHWA